jgi:hypothetical protein
MGTKRPSQTSSTKSILGQNGLSKFEAAITSARASKIREMADIKSLADYYTLLNTLLLWVPCQDIQGTDVYKSPRLQPLLPVLLRARPTNNQTPQSDEAAAISIAHYFGNASRHTKKWWGLGMISWRFLLCLDEWP